MSQSKDGKEQSSRIASGIGRRGFGRSRQGEPVVKPKNFIRTIRRLWLYLNKERKLLILIFILMLADSLLSLIGPYLIGMSIDAMSVSMNIVDFKKLEIIVITLVFVYVFNGLLSFCQGWIMAGVSQQVVTNLRSTLFGKMQKLPIVFFDQHSHGELMSRLSNDIENVSSTISQSTTQLLSGSIAIIGSLIMMIALSPSLTLVSLLTAPLIILLARIIAKKTSKLFKEQQMQLGRLNGHIEETISGIQVVKAFNYEDKVIAEFDEINTKLCGVGLRAQIWSGFLMPLMNVINNIGFALIAIVGGVLAIDNLITVGVIASFLSYSRQFARPLNDIASLFNLLQSGVAGAERVFEILDEQEETPDRPNAVVLEKAIGNVVFKNVSFGYRADVSVLKNVSFVANEGSSTALVGPTGAGKTTIVNLVTRFYDVTNGEILLDGRDIKDYTRDSVRRSFGIVLQDAYLFSGTIKENLKYGKPDATDEEMKAAAVMANADAFIARLPEKYDTLLSENGGSLSQGQKQLLAIARVILTKPSILILDEATSSIDTRTELHIQDALLKIMEGRTSFVIAHRLNTIRDADNILVIDHGKIVEKGSHDFLIYKKGVYHGMFFNQFQLEIE
ncbi:ABC transporter ATP-binding protein [Pelosinus sp. IPA-1]|uniref:ABC transporter ATP-binding protein n=1 Tax=Pelosinus sp. IPA-1 TaxID=3029569 RepID=UPI0024361ED3|nr:ABC transporter ATP-binding protein [Pelosinus sp. IPA-1]GMB00577.1 putative ABC transporter ATP-binding protein [Pelosinus sp. IPA-1]